MMIMKKLILVNNDDDADVAVDGDDADDDNDDCDDADDDGHNLLYICMNNRFPIDKYIVFWKFINSSKHYFLDKP